MESSYRKNRSDRNAQSTQSDRNDQSTQSNRSDQSDWSDRSNSLQFLPRRGHYTHLRVYHVTEALYDITYIFCKRFLPSYGDRTVDQMVQAARSGKQNIAEGNQAATTSSQTEIKLTNVARASLEELMVDYEDYLRTRSLQKWGKEHPRLIAMRKWTCSKSFAEQYKTFAARMSDEEMANLGITLCRQSIYLLDRLIKTQEDRFVKQGGVKEQMHAARTGYLQKKEQEMMSLRLENEQLRARIVQLEEYIGMKGDTV